MALRKLSPTTLRRHKGASFTGISTPFICYDNSGKIFMAQRSKNARDEHGHWDCGAGGLKHGQAVQESMLRELREEYGVIEPISVDFLGYFDVFRTLNDGTKTHWVALPFAVQVNTVDVSIMEPDMVDDSGWFELDALPQPLHTAWPKIFLPQFGDKLKAVIRRRTGASV